MPMLYHNAGKAVPPSTPTKAHMLRRQTLDILGFKNLMTMSIFAAGGSPPPIPFLYLYTPVRNFRPLFPIFSFFNSFSLPAFKALFNFFKLVYIEAWKVYYLSNWYTSLFFKFSKFKSLFLKSSPTPLSIHPSSLRFLPSLYARGV